MSDDQLRGEDPKSPVDEKVRLMFRQGHYADAVPFLKDWLQGHSQDAPAWELLADAMRFSGDKGGSAAALANAADRYNDAGMTIQSIAAQKKLNKLGVAPDFGKLKMAAARVRTPLFDQLSEDEFEDVAESLESQRFESGQSIVREGEPGAAMFILVRGKAEVLTRQGTEEVKLAELGGGDFFGESSLLSGRPRTATVRARTDVECLVLSKDEYEAAIARHPRILEVMEKFNADRAASAVEQLLRKRKG